MVTTQGFNALLKIVEEPPPHVKFIFATTEPDKVIGTIRSRTHHYPFRLVPPAPCSDYLARSAARRRASRSARACCRSSCAPAPARCATRCRVLDQLIAGSGPMRASPTTAPSRCSATPTPRCSTTSSTRSRPVTGRRVFRVSRPCHRDRPRPAPVRRRPARAAARPDRHRRRAGWRARGPARRCPRTSWTGCAARPPQFGAAGLSRAADITNAALTEMTGATSPRLQLELICRPASCSRAPTARAGTPRAWTGSSAASTVERDAGRLRPPRSRSSARPRPAVPAPTRPAPESSAPSDRSTCRADCADRRDPRPTSDAVQCQRRHAGRADVGAVDVEAIRRMWPDVLSRVYQQRRATWTFVSEHAQVIDYDGKRLRLAISTDGLLQTFRRGPHAELVRQALIDVLGVDAQVEGIRLESGGPAAAPGRSAPIERPSRTSPRSPRPIGPQPAASPGTSRRPSPRSPGAPPRTPTALRRPRGRGARRAGRRPSAPRPPERPRPRPSLRTSRLRTTPTWTAPL